MFSAADGMVAAAASAPVAADAEASAPEATAKPQERPPADADLARLRAALAAGKLSADQLLQRSLERIKAFDTHGPLLNSLVAVDPRAAGSGRRSGGGGSDSARPRPGRDVGALSGIPVVVGDTIDVQGLPTTLGSASLRGHRPRADAAAVAALRNAGAVLFAKGNTRELGLLPSRPGYSSAGGQTLNPYNTARVSSGVAAAIAAGLAPVGIGSDGAGDLLSAAAQAGLVAIRPSQGSVSIAGVFPAPLSLDAIGPLARSVADAALVLALLQGSDPQPAIARLKSAVAHHLDADGDSGEDAVKEEDGDVFRGTRLGIFGQLAGGHRAVDQAFDQALRRLRGDGAEAIELRLPSGFVEGWPDWRALVRETELRDQLNAYLAQVLDGRPNRIEALLRMSESPLIRGSESPVDPAAVAVMAGSLNGPGLANADYLEVVSVQLPVLRFELRGLIAEHDLDALVFPTTLCPAPSRLDDYDRSYDCDATDPTLPSGLASASGLPEITLPMGQTASGLPVGLSFLGAPDSEAVLIELGLRFEQLRNQRPWPSSVPRRRDPERSN